MRQMKSMIMKIMGKMRRGLRPRRSMSGTQMMVVITLTTPVERMAYWMFSSAMPAPLKMDDE